MINPLELGITLGERQIACGGHPNEGALFPVDDTLDISKGAIIIPFEVTDARRLGQNVKFVQPDPFDQSIWYWKMPEGSKIEHGVWQ